MRPLRLLSLISAAALLATASHAWELDLSSTGFLPNSNFSGRLGVGLGVKGTLLQTPFDYEIKGSYLSSGTASDLAAQIQIIPLELNVLWNHDLSFPFRLGAGLNQSYWSSGTLSSLSFSGGLGFQIFVDSQTWESPIGDLALRVGYQNNAAQISSSSGSSAANVDCIFIASQFQIGQAAAKPQLLVENNRDTTPKSSDQPARLVAETDLPVTDVPMPMPVSAKKSLAPEPKLIIGEIPDQYKKGSKISLRLRSSGPAFKTAWVELNGKPWSNLVDKKTYFISELNLPKNLKGKIKLDYFARSSTGQLFSHRKIIELIP